ncbi:serine protease [Acaryochloris sp. CCMEE 5410]|uniref:serine protease n=1 Tax=Acaryochloris sp. CCMEE 5410 TaxID=310037 RepID=UPI0021D382A7|nr:serine protease [Acaryochloris sp. CCMEE 5410]KAI9132064.1 tetratricopeptide repeat protein [Acaryochloris sp. CCMEE 5410]
MPVTPNAPLAPLAQANPGQEQATYAQKISVRVSSNTNQGSGTLLSKQGNTYLVLTNAHVIRGAQTLNVQTHDGQTHTAQVVPNSFPNNYDLALVQFQSSQPYTLAEIGTFQPKVGQQLFTGGYAAESGTFSSNSGQVQKILPQPLQAGYQIGFDGNVPQGVSGGPLFEATSGQLIGVQGRSANPLIDNYTQADGTPISPEDRKKLRQHNWAIPIQTVLAQIETKLLIAYELPTPQQDTKLVQPNWTGWLAELEQQAQQFTVRINNMTENTNGSGVIIAKQGNTYTVLTAEHVLHQKPGTQPNFTLTTADGQDHALTPNRIRRQPGVDLAVIEFESKANYAVATLANYRQSKNDVVFVAGFPKIGQTAPQWLMSSGGIFEQEQGRFNTTNIQITGRTQAEASSSLAVTQGSFAQGYDLLYTSITYGGMSGGPVLNYQGHVIGIHGQAEAEESSSGESVIQLGNSLGIPINTFLGLASRLQVPLQKQATTPPPTLDQQRNSERRQALLNIAIPTENAAPEIWIQRGNQLRRLGRDSEAIAAFERAIQLNRDYVHLAYFGKAQALSNQDKLQLAITALKEVIRRQPSYTPAWEYLASFHRKQQQYEQALEAINQAIEQQPQNANLYSEKHSILSELGRKNEALAAINQALKLSERAAFYLNRGFTYFGLKQYPNAIADSDKAIALNPEYAEAYSNRGNVYRVLAQYPQAIADFDKAINLNPELPEAYFNRGLTYYDLAQYPNAIADYDKAINLNPEYAEAYNNRGATYTNLKQYPQAIADFDKAIALNPEYALAYNNRGIANDALAQYPQAITDFDKAIALNPEYAEAYSNRGNVYRVLAQYPQAIADYDKAIALNPEFVLAYNGRGLAYHALQQYPQAIADYDKAIALNPEHALAYMHKGTTYRNLNQYSQAIVEYDKAINLNPEFVLAYQGRGITYFALKQFPQAITNFDEAINLNPEDAMAYNFRGIAYKFLKQFPQAIADYDKAIALNPEYAEAYRDRGLAHAQTGNITQAKQDLQKAAKLFQQQNRPEDSQKVMQLLQQL